MDLKLEQQARPADMMVQGFKMLIIEIFKMFAALWENSFIRRIFFILITAKFKSFFCWAITSLIMIRFPLDMNWYIQLGIDVTFYAALFGFLYNKIYKQYPGNFQMAYKRYLWSIAHITTAAAVTVVDRMYWLIYAFDDIGWFYVIISNMLLEFKFCFILDTLISYWGVFF